MTKRDLIEALEPFSDDQYVFVNLHSERYPHGSMVGLQGVRVQEPWHEGPRELVGLLAHADNRELGVTDEQLKERQVRFQATLDAAIREVYQVA